MRGRKGRGNLKGKEQIMVQAQREKRREGRKGEKDVGKLDTLPRGEARKSGVGRKKVGYGSGGGGERKLPL